MTTSKVTENGFALCLSTRANPQSFWSRTDEVTSARQPQALWEGGWEI